MSTDNELLKELDHDIKNLQSLIETKPTDAQDLVFDEDNDADDDIIISILEKVEEVHDEYNDNEDDDDEDDDFSHITNSTQRKELREKIKALRTEMKAAIKKLKSDKSLDKIEFRKKRKELRKNFRKQKRSDRQAFRTKIRAERQVRRAARKEKRLSQGQRSGIVNLFRNILSKAKDTLINIAINGLKGISNKMDEKSIIKPYILQIIEFLQGLKSSGLSNENPATETWSEDSLKVDQFVSKVKDAANHIKINAKITLNEIFKKVLQFLSASPSPILQIVTVVLTPFLTK